MKNVLTLAAVLEAATGLALVVAPALVGQLLLGVELSGVASVVGRVAGFALIALGLSCLPGGTPLVGMLTYSALATLYLAYLGFEGTFTGRLLWPAVGLHVTLTILLAGAARVAKVTKPRIASRASNGSP
jgi:hypothetical protein